MLASKTQIAKRGHVLQFKIRMLCILLLSAIASSGNAGGKMDATYRKSIDTWRAAKEQDLRAPDNWLALVGLFWLKPGANTFGPDKTNLAHLPEGSVNGGVFTVEGNSVYLEKFDATGISINQKPVLVRTLLKTDRTDQPDEITSGKIKMNVIDREGRLGIRAWDPENPERKTFPGRQWFAVNEGLRIKAKFKAFDKPADLDIKNVVGMKLRAQSPGHLDFEVNGEKYSLLAEGDPTKGFFINFKDKTNGKSTYGAGRFLGTDAVVNGEVVIDFNKAVNPPCAFTTFATCPLAPRENSLKIAVEAGEKYNRTH
jgi:uncharacterized protein (DUF1684 family)